MDIGKHKQNLTPLTELGEFGIIKRYSNRISIVNKEVEKGIGDDSAILHFDDENRCVVSSDMLVEGVHFDLGYVPLKHLGYKSVVVNISDILAMNAKPIAITLNIAMSNRFTVEALDQFYEGVLLACNKFNVDLIGGDTTSSKSGLIISITAFGKAKKSEIVYRNGAKKNDLVCVNGNLGAAFAGLMILEREKAIFLQNAEVQPILTDYTYVIERQLKPEPGVSVIEFLRNNEIIPTAMIDISDGLASELLHICSESGCGVRIFEEKIPIDTETRKVAELFRQGTIGYALYGGEDYNLLFTIDQKYYDLVEKNEAISIIGYISDVNDGSYWIDNSGTLNELKAEGWNHFKS